MDWIALLGAVGIGAITAKLLDVLFLHKMAEKSEKSRWIRDNKLNAFSLLSKDLLSLGISRDDPASPFEGYATASKALLMIDDEDLFKRIDQFIVDLSVLRKLSLKKDQESEEKAHDIYDKLVIDARSLVFALRQDLLVSS